MDKKMDLNILFIGNSHTYYNDMPRLVKLRADEEGYNCRVTMLAHPNWFLSQHAEEPEARFNILYGKYDYVVLQEHAHPFGPEEEFILNRLEREKRCGHIEEIDKYTCKYVADVFDATEMVPWLRTFIGRVVKLECSSKAVEDRFYGDLDAMRKLYGGNEDAVQ